MDRVAHCQALSEPVPNSAGAEPSDNARSCWLSDQRRRLRSGDPEIDREALIEEIAATGWEQRLCMRRIRAARAAGDRKAEDQERRFYDRHRAALILLRRELAALNRTQRPARAHGRNSDIELILADMEERFG